MLPLNPNPTGTEPARSNNRLGGDVRIVRIAGKTDAAASGRMYLADAQGSPAGGSPIEDFRIPGSGVYVVDCPVGTPALLEFDRDGGRRFEIFPGMVIPERYGSFRVVDLPDTVPITPAVNSAYVNTADSAIVLAVGPRGHEYRAPGYRVQRFTSGTLGFAGIVTGPGVFSAGSNYIRHAGYDLLVALVSELTGATAFGSLQNFRYPNLLAVQTLSIENQTDGITAPAGVFLPFYAGGPLIQQASGGAHGAAILGGLLDISNGVTRGNPAIPFPIGNLPHSVQFQIKNETAGALTYTVAAYGVIKVTS